MTQAAGKTGVGPTVTVAVEQHFPPEQRVLQDDLAYSILPAPMRAVVQLTRPPFVRDWMVKSLEKSAPGIWGGLMCRKRYIDEKLIDAATDTAGQIEALVNLGAGFDTRAYRLPALAHIPVWEVDQPQNIEAKRARLRKLFGEVPAHVTLVPIDFDRQELNTVLAAHGYVAGMHTFFIWEAVTQYLTEAGMRVTFEFLAQAAPASRLVFTYVLADFLAGHVLYGQAALRKQYVVDEKLWLFGMDPEHLAEFIGEYGWHVLEHPTYDDLAGRYVKPTGRSLATTPIERIVYAERRTNNEDSH